MFSRFRNLFSKNKSDLELETSEVETLNIESSEFVEAPVINASSKKEVNDSIEQVSKLEGLKFLKSLVETEQKSLNNEAVISSIPVVDNSYKAATSLSQEVANMLKDKLSNYNENLQIKEEAKVLNKSINTLNGEKLIPTEIPENDVIQSLTDEVSVTLKETESEPIDLLNNDNKEIPLVQPETEDTSEMSKFQPETEDTSEMSKLLNKTSEHFSNDQENELKETTLENAIKVLDETCDSSNLNSEIFNKKDKEINSDKTKTEEITKVVEPVSQSSEVSPNDISFSNSTEVSNTTSDISVTNPKHNEDLNNVEKEVALGVIKPINMNLNDQSPHVSKIDQNNVENSIENLKESPQNVVNKESEITNNENDSVNEILQELISEASKQVPEQPQYEISEINSKNSHENTPDFSESSHSSSITSVKENNANSSTYYPSTDSDSNLYTNSSIVVDDLPSEVNTPSPTVDSTISGSSSNTSTLDSSVLTESSDPTKIIVNPIDSNILACNAITSKLSDIAEVAESLDTVIRNIQENSQAVEVESNPSPSDKKLGTLRSTSSEDWHSRSTEDDSFATASEGNFTPHSHSSSSFQTASGRTSSYISCDKNSFDASEADDSTYAFEMPELTSPLNMSFEGSDQSYASAQHLDNDQTSLDKEQTPTKLSESGSQTFNQLEYEEDQSSIADVEELHSESVTPTPQENQDYHIDSIPVESETELEVAGISDAPSMEILTETVTMPMSRTPEVSSSPSTSAACTNQQILNNTEDDDATLATSNEQNTNIPNAAWRRSKYYENITKQTIKGFL